jgi:hypothetical protein
MSLESPEIILYRPGDSMQRFETLHGWNIDDVVILNYPFFNQVEAFCESVLDQLPPRVTGEDGKHVIECVIAAYISSWRGVKVTLPVQKTPDLTELFKAIKERDAKSYGYEYSVDAAPHPPLSIPEHILGHRPPRTKEVWSDTEHGMRGLAELEGLPRRLKRMRR